MGRQATGASAPRALGSVGLNARSSSATVRCYRSVASTKRISGACSLSENTSTSPTNSV